MIPGPEATISAAATPDLMRYATAIPGLQNHVLETLKVGLVTRQIFGSKQSEKETYLGFGSPKGWTSILVAQPPPHKTIAIKCAFLSPHPYNGELLHQMPLDDGQGEGLPTGGNYTATPMSRIVEDS